MATKYIRVLRTAIKANTARGTQTPQPPLLMRVGGKNINCWEIEILGPSRLRWRDGDDPPGPLGASIHCWLETDAPVRVSEKTYVID